MAADLPPDSYPPFEKGGPGGGFRDSVEKPGVSFTSGSFVSVRKRSIEIQLRAVAQQKQQKMDTPGQSGVNSLEPFRVTGDILPNESLAG